MLANGWRWSLHLSWRLRHPVNKTDMANGPDFGIIDGDNDPFIDEGLIVQRIFRPPSWLHRDANLRRGIKPVLRGILRVGLFHLRVIVSENHEFAVIRTDSRRIVGGLGDAIVDIDGVALRNTQSERGIRHPVLNPIAVGAFKVALAAARIKDPTHVAVSFGMLRTLPTTSSTDENAL